MTSRTGTASTLSLPMTAVFTVQRKADRFVARALDLDLVTVAGSEEDALQKLRLAVKTHIEFGIKNGLCKEDILLSAPEEHWSMLTAESSVKIGEPIEIEGTKIRTMVRSQPDEAERRTIAA